MSRRNRILMLALAAQVILLVVIQSAGQSMSALNAEQSLLPGFDKKTVDQIEIYTIGLEGQKGEELAIALARQGSGWVLANHQNYPAQPDKVDSLLEAAANLKSRGPIASGDARLAQLSVADTHYERKIVLKQGNKSTVLFMGGAAGGRRTAFRIGNSKDVHAVTSFANETVPAGIRPWIDPTYFTVSYDQIESMTVANPNGTFVFARNGANWKVTFNGSPLVVPPGKELDVEKLPSFVRRIAAIDVREPAAPRVAKNLTKITLQMKDEKPANEQDTSSSAQNDRYLETTPNDEELAYVQERGRPPVLADGTGLNPLSQLKVADLLRTPTAPPKKTGKAGK